MRIRITVPEEHVQPDVINPVLEAVTRLDEHMIRSGQSPTASELVQAGARWKPEPPGDEHFDNGGTIAQRGHGDCDDWAPLRAAELRATGQDPGAAAIVVPSGPNLWHALVKRSDGSVDDPSVAAGMPSKGKRHAVVGGGEFIEIMACDPHDGRVYQGSLAPTVGPLSMHCGPQVAVRGVRVRGETYYEGRCDMPLTGSPLLEVRGRCHGRRVLGCLPYGISCTSAADRPDHALASAITGALMCGDAAELSPNLDRYKLIALQMATMGHSAAEARDAVAAAMFHDLESSEAHSGVPAAAHFDALRGQLAAEGVHVVGFGSSGMSGVGDIFGDIGHAVNNAASGVVHLVAPVANAAMKVANVVPWGDIVHGLEAAVSVVPGLGTAVADVLAAGETYINAAEAILSGSPLKFAIEAAYNFALASIPGAAAIRIVLDPSVKRLIDIALSKTLVESGELDKMLKSVPDQPKIGNVSPRSILASLAHLVVGHLGMKNTSGHPAAKSTTPAKSSTFQTAPAIVPAQKPAGVIHAAVHADVAPTEAKKAGINPFVFLLPLAFA